MEFLLEKRRTDDMLDEVISFRGEVRMRDLAKLRLSAFDRALLEDISGDMEATPADYLLGLEMIFRRQAVRQVRSTAGLGGMATTEE